MVVIGLKIAWTGTDTLSQLQLWDDSGRILARTKITQTNTSEKSEFRPIVFDNVNLTTSTKLTIVFTKGSSSNATIFSYTMPKAYSFEKTFNNKTVYAMSPYVANKLFSNIMFPNPTIKAQSSDFAINTQTRWYQVMNKAEFTIARQQDSIITNLFGTHITDLTKLVEHPRFIVYQPLVGNNAYLRLMVRLY